MDADEVTNRNTVSTKQSKLQFFRFVIEVECKKEFSNKLSLNANKSPGLSDSMKFLFFQIMTVLSLFGVIG